MIFVEVELGMVLVILGLVEGWPGAAHGSDRGMGEHILVAAHGLPSGLGGEHGQKTMRKCVR
jgi:hypothetical protein